MGRKRLYHLPLLYLFAASLCTGQEIERNWYLETIGRDYYMSRYDFTLYTQADVSEAVKLFRGINTATPTDEWEGTYTHGTMVGEAKLHWNSKNFVYYYVYHTLGDLDFGSIADGADAVRLTSKRSASPNRKPTFPHSLVKVRFGDRHYLVPENRLGDFAERAVGLSTNLTDYDYYFLKDGDSDKPVDVPILPVKYKHLMRSSITSRIIKVNGRRVRQPSPDMTHNGEVIHIVTLEGGRSKRIKVGMNFFVDALGEWVEITTVNAQNSIGRIRRDYDGSEICRELEHGQGIGTPCKPIKVGMVARTKVSDAYF